jgi:translocation protein SEC72
MDLDTFVQLPLSYDPKNKTLSSSHADSTLKAELDALNTLHRSLISAHKDGLPPPPVPVDPKRSSAIQKLRESGNTAFRKNDHAGAVKLYSLGIDMAAQRPLWEPSGLVREELTQLYANRAQAYMAGNFWAEGAIDAQCSVELKKVQNAKAWWRRGRCLLEMGRAEEAREWVAEALDFEGQEADLVSLMEEIEKKIKK